MQFENYEPAVHGMTGLTPDQQAATEIMVSFVQAVFAASDPLKLVQRSGFEVEDEGVIAALIDTARISIETSWEEGE